VPLGPSPSSLLQAAMTSSSVAEEIRCLRVSGAGGSVICSESGGGIGRAGGLSG
jgi:hypothetical protein